MTNPKGRLGGSIFLTISSTFLCLLTNGAEVSSEHWKFKLGTGARETGWTAVTPDSFYSASTGFGFESPVAVTAISREVGSEHSEYITADKPFLFSAKVPEGNYRVSVTLGDSDGESVTTVKAESRRLMLERVETVHGQIVTRSFIVNIRTFHLPPPPLNAPGGSEVRLNDREQGVLHWDDKLTLEFNDSAPKVSAIEIQKIDVPTVYLAGDSTVTDQPREPGASWGQMLPRFFKPEIAVANHAESGETLKSFLTGLRLDKILSEIRTGDYLFIQFGHNDSKTAWPQTYVEAATTYRDYLKVYIDEARRRGATPVLLTSMQRRTFDDKGKIRNSHGGYPEAVRQVASDNNVALIDLSVMSTRLYEALGTAKAPLAFSGTDEHRDATHHDNYGAYELARCVVEGIKANHLPLEKFLTDDATPFDPERPDAVETFRVPASPGRSNVTPRGN